METYQERVIEEKKGLDARINKLSKFNESEAYFKLEANERIRLSGQLVAMHTYSNFLNERINCFQVA